MQKEDAMDGIRSPRMVGARRAALVCAVALLVTACSGTTATPSPTSPASSAPVASPAASEAAVSPASSTSATKHVAILNKDMTDEEIRAEVAKEGSIVIANWTYTANDEIVKQFTQYVKDKFGADVKVDYEGTQAPTTYLTNLAAAVKAGNPSPYDVMNIEENYWADAIKNGLPQDFLPSDLVPNQSLVFTKFQHVPTSIAFQATAVPLVVFNNKTASFIKQTKDLADPRLKGKITVPLPGDITAGGFFMNLADELGKDYKDPDQMKQVVDWFITNIGPNVLKYTTDTSEIMQLLQTGAIDAAGFWLSLARQEYLAGYTDILPLWPTKLYPMCGYEWIPKGAVHPVLAQIYVNWRLNPDVQFPNSWPIEHSPWSELNEGFLGPSYEQANLIPDWFAQDYYKYYPKIEEYDTKLVPVDWEAYNKSAQVWQDYYAQKIGQ
jgi:spermidine/putrescine-binding protein